MAVATVRNGVDVDQLVQTIDAIKGDPRIAGFTFSATTRWIEGSTSTGEITSFSTRDGRSRTLRRTSSRDASPKSCWDGTRGPMRSN